MGQSSFFAGGHDLVARLDVECSPACFAQLRNESWRAIQRAVGRRIFPQPRRRHPQRRAHWWRHASRPCGWAIVPRRRGGNFFCRASRRIGRQPSRRSPHKCHWRRLFSWSSIRRIRKHQSAGRTFGNRQRRRYAQPRKPGQRDPQRRDCRRRFAIRKSSGRRAHEQRFRQNSLIALISISLAPHRLQVNLLNTVRVCSWRATEI